MSCYPSEKTERDSRPFFSIIIPAYNAARYIGECFDSCFHQDIAAQEYEIICVDDDSSDDTVTILKRYEDAYDNFKVICSSENKGVSFSRNRGIEQSLGSYLWFIDADDFIGENVLGALKDKCIAADPDSLIFKGYYFNDHLSDEELRLKKEGRLPVPDKYKTAFCTHRLFKAEIIRKNGIRFLENVSYGEDQLFNFMFRKYSEKNEEYDQLLYYHRNHSASVMHGIDMDKYLSSIVVGADCLREFSKNEPASGKAETIDYMLQRISFALDRIAQMPSLQAKKYLRVLSEKGYYPYVPSADIRHLIRRSDLCGRKYYRKQRFSYLMKHKIGERIVHPRRTLSNVMRKIRK